MVMRRVEGAAIANDPIIKRATSKRPNIPLFKGRDPKSL
jgi:hypothetical protein